LLRRRKHVAVTVRPCQRREPPDRAVDALFVAGGDVDALAVAQDRTAVVREDDQLIDHPVRHGRTEQSLFHGQFDRFSPGPSHTCPDNKLAHC
jgi:hypothetical protein